MKPNHTTKSEELNTQLLNHEFCCDDGFIESSIPQTSKSFCVKV